MVSSPLDAIRRVVEAFEQSEWTEIDVLVGDVRVHLATGTPTNSRASSLGTTSVPAAPPALPTNADDPSPDGAGDDPPATASDRSSATSATELPTALPTGAHVVVSPSPGILWRSPEPGARPFADIGDVVDSSATVGIVEVMKLMTHVKAGVSGEIIAVCVENGVAVQKGEPLFAIAPSGSSS
jgi:acetyl-CoA carboxylase biotin carboxyl carrier protein